MDAKLEKDYAKTPKSVPRHFRLRDTQLFYYRSGTVQDIYYNLYLDGKIIFQADTLLSYKQTNKKKSKEQRDSVTCLKVAQQ